MPSKPEDKAGEVEYRAADPGHNIIHGAGPEQSTRVSRADKAAPLPEPSKGAGLEQPSSSGGEAAGKDQGGRGRTH